MSEVPDPDPEPPSEEAGRGLSGSRSHSARRRREDTTKPSTPDRGGPDDEVPRLFWWLPVAGLAAVLAYSITQGFFTTKSLVVLSTASISAGAALLVGAFLGFLFGYPQRSSAAQGTARASAAFFELNTNLAQVSDWLTKILIGIGLVELGGLVDRLSDVGSALGSQLGKSEATEAFATGLVIYFLVAGFLLAYLWTALRFARMLEVARRALEPPPAPLPPSPDPPPQPDEVDGSPS